MTPMRRLVSVTALAMIATAAIVGGIPTLPPARAADVAMARDAGSPAPAPGADIPDRIKTSPRAGSTPTISVTLYGLDLDWYGEPGALVGATALNDGLVVGTAYQTAADDNGRARLRFSNMALRSTDDLVIVAAGHPVITVTLPVVAADLDAAGDRVGGKAPPGSRVRVALRGAGDGSPRLDRDVAVDVTGRFLIAAEPGVDLRPSDAGEVEYVDPAGNRIRGVLAAPRVAVEIGRPVGCVRVRDHDFNVEVRGADDFVKSTGCDRPRTEPVLAGDRVTLELGPDFLVPDAPPTVSLRVPAFNVSFDLLAGRLQGEGPPSQRLIVELESPFQATGRQEVRTDAQGQFSLPLTTDLACMAIVRLDAGNGLTVRQRFGLTTVLVGLRNAIVAGAGGSRIEPVDVDLALLDSAGNPKAEQYLTLGVGAMAEIPWAGDWSDLENHGGGVSPVPGDRLETQVGDSDMAALTVPELTAEADAATDAIAGSAPPGAELVVTFQGASLTEPIHPPIRATADGQGRYRVELAGVVDIRPGDWGLVATWSPRTPVEFYTIWSSLQLSLNLDTGSVGGTGALSETFHVELRDPSGSLTATAEDTSPGVLSFYNLRLAWERWGWWTNLWRDALNPQAGMQAGSVVTVQGSGRPVSLEIPRVSLRADPEADEITGLIPPDHHLEIYVSTLDSDNPARVGKSFTGEVPVGADGQFRLDLAGRFDLQGGDTVDARVFTPSGHEVTLAVKVPVFEVSLDNGWITGNLPAPQINLPVTATLRRDSAVVARGSGVSNWWSYALPLRDESGAAVVPQAGDRVEVDLGTDPPTRLALEMPDLSVAMDWREERLRGWLRSPGTMDLSIWSYHGSDGIRHHVYPWPGSDGAFDVRIFRPGATGPWAYPGNFGDFSVYLPSGYIVRRTFLYPRLSLELGGARVEAQVTALTRVTAEVLDAAGNAIARGQARSEEVVGDYDNDSTNSVVVPLADALGPVRLQPGQRVRVTAGDATLETIVPDLTVNVNWTKRLLDGSGPAGRHFEEAQQADRGCRAETGFSWEPTSTRRFWSDYALFPLRQDASGRFLIEDFVIAAGKRFMVGYLAPDGHRVYRTIQRPSTIVDLAGGSVEGCSQPLEPVTVELRDEDTALRAQAHATAGADGRYHMTFSTTTGTTMPIRPTDSVHVCAIGDCVDVPVHFATIAFEDDTAISGQVAAGHTAFLEVTPRYPFTRRPEYPQIEGGSKKYWYPYTGPLALDADGHFRLTDDTLLPTYRPWRIADLPSIGLWSEIDDGHYVVARTTPRRAIYLPRADAPRRSGGP